MASKMLASGGSFGLPPKLQFSELRSLFSVQMHGAMASGDGQ